MNNYPVVVVTDSRRSVLAFVVLIIVGCGPATLVVLLGWWPLGDIATSLVVLAIANLLVYVLLIRLIVARIFPDLMAGRRALSAGDYARAVELLDRHAALVDRHRWLETWRTVLFLDPSRFGLRETSWQLCGFCCASLGEPDRALAFYERCLTVSPASIISINTLNLILLLRGKPVRPQHEIVLRYAFDRGRRGLRRLVPSLIPLLLGLALMCPASIVLVSFQVDSPLLYPLMLLGVLWFAVIVRYGYHWLARHIFLSAMLQGFEQVKQGDNEGAIDSFERQYNSLTLNPLLDQWRLVLLFETSVYSCREWLLLYQVTPWVQLGRADRVVAAYEECLKLNPHNIYARSGLDIMRKLQAAISQETGHSSPS